MRLIEPRIVLAVIIILLTLHLLFYVLLSADLIQTSVAKKKILRYVEVED